MKRLFIIFLIIAMTLTLFASCQATPEQAVVIGKGDGQLEEKIEAQKDAPPPSDIPESGTRITETFKHDSLPITIEVDALVETQDGKTMPAVKVTPHKFTQEEVDKVYDYYVGDAHFFRIPDGEPWAFHAEQSIKDAEARLEYAKANGDDADFIQRLENNLNIARQDYLIAKDSSEFPGIAHTLRGGNLVSGEITEGFYGYFEKDDKAYRLYVANNDNGMSGVMELKRIDMDEALMEQYEVMFGIGPQIEYLNPGESLREISYSDALVIAEETVSAFGAQGMAPAHVEGKQYPENTLDSYYTFVFTHAVNSVPCIYNAVAIANDMGYSDVWDYEKFIVVVDARGVKRAYWAYPVDVSEQLTKSTPMIPFKEVMNCFSKMVFIKNSYLENDVNMRINTGVVSGMSGRGIPDKKVSGDSYDVDSVVVMINRITLGLMRVQSGTDYLLIPVWDFYGYKQLLTADGENIMEITNNGTYEPSEECLLIVNAIDGSIIDLEKGY